MYRGLLQNCNQCNTHPSRRRTSANRLAASRPACCSLDVTQLTRMPRLPTGMPGRAPLGACRQGWGSERLEQAAGGGGGGGGGGRQQVQASSPPACPTASKLPSQKLVAVDGACAALSTKRAARPHPRRVLRGPRLPHRFVQVLPFARRRLPAAPALRLALAAHVLAGYASSEVPSALLQEQECRSTESACPSAACMHQAPPPASAAPLLQGRSPVQLVSVPPGPYVSGCEPLVTASVLGNHASPAAHMLHHRCSLPPRKQRREAHSSRLHAVCTAATELTLHHVSLWVNITAAAALQSRPMIIMKCGCPRLPTHLPAMSHIRCCEAVALGRSCPAQERSAAGERQPTRVHVHVSCADGCCAAGGRTLACGAQGGHRPLHPAFPDTAHVVNTHISDRLSQRAWSPERPCRC